MSLTNNQSPCTDEQQAMDALASVCAATSFRGWKEEKNSFLGQKRSAEQKDTESYMTPVEALENPPPKDKQELGQCHRYSKKGQKDDCCKQQVTVQPYGGKRQHLVYYEEC